MRSKPEMTVIFRRTGTRRYAVEVKRPPYTDLEMNPAPGYDALIPHDLMHLVVESQLGLSHAIFGQLAAGGNAGTFRIVMKENWTPLAGARISRKAKTKSKHLLRAGKKECAESERATYICWQMWLARSQYRRASARAISAQSQQLRYTTKELRLTEKKLDQICQHLDRLSSRWSKLEIGEGIAVRWPDLELSSE